jgi:hypothetical protein
MLVRRCAPGRIRTCAPASGAKLTKSTPVGHTFGTVCRPYSEHRLAAAEHEARCVDPLRVQHGQENREPSYACSIPATSSRPPCAAPQRPVRPRASRMKDVDGALQSARSLTPCTCVHRLGNGAWRSFTRARAPMRPTSAMYAVSSRRERVLTDDVQDNRRYFADHVVPLFSAIESVGCRIMACSGRYAHPRCRCTRGLPAGNR